MNTSPKPIVRPVPKKRKEGGLVSIPLPLKLFSSAAPRVCLPTPTHSGPAWSPAPLPGAAQGQERCGNFPSDSAAGWLLLRSLAWHRHQAGWASFPAGPGPAQPRLTLCRLQGQEWVSGPRYPAPSLRPRPCFPPPAPACSLCPGLFPPIFLLSYFLRLSLWAAPDSSKKSPPGNLLVATK